MSRQALAMGKQQTKRVFRPRPPRQHKNVVRSTQNVPTRRQTSP